MNAAYNNSSTLLFLIILILLSAVLKLFYIIQRKLFMRSYYSISEILVGLPKSLTWSQAFLVRFLPPVIIGYIAYILLNNIFPRPLFYYSVIGGFFMFVGVIRVLTDKERKMELKEYRIPLHKVVIMYFLYFVSFALASFWGALMASIFSARLTLFLPSRQGIIDGIWTALFLIIINFIIDKMSRQI